MSKVITAAFAAILIALTAAACSSSTSDTPSSTSSGASSAASDESSGSPIKTDTDETSGQDIAQQVIDKIDIPDIGFPCSWKDNTETDSIVTYMVCDKHQIILATSPQHENVKVWIESIAQGWGVLGDNYALISPNHDTVNRLWDLLGADGKVIDLSSQ